MQVKKLELLKLLQIYYYKFEKYNFFIFEVYILKDSSKTITLEFIL